VANKNQRGRKPRKMSASMEEAVSLLKPMKGRNGLYGCFSKNDHGEYTEVGVYNYSTKKYAIFRTEYVDSTAVDEIKEVIKGQ